MKINKGQFRLSSRRQNLKFELRRGQGHLLSYLKNRLQWHFYPRFHHLSEFPSHVDIELMKKFPTLSVDKEFFSNLVCFVSKMKSEDSEYLLDVLINVNTNEIETIQVEEQE